MIMNIRRTNVTVYLQGEGGIMEQFQTYVNLEPFDAAKYYVGSKFNLSSNGFNYIMTCMYVRCDGVQEWQYGKWADIPHPDSLAHYHFAGGGIVRSEW